MVSRPKSFIDAVSTTWLFPVSFTTAPCAKKRYSSVYSPSRSRRIKSRGVSFIIQVCSLQAQPLVPLVLLVLPWSLIMSLARSLSRVTISVGRATRWRRRRRCRVDSLPPSSGALDYRLPGLTWMTIIISPTKTTTTTKKKDEPLSSSFLLSFVSHQQFKSSARL